MLGRRKIKKKRKRTKRNKLMIKYVEGLSQTPFLFSGTMIAISAISLFVKIFCNFDTTG
jgi:hypothetical protein